MKIISLLYILISNAYSPSISKEEREEWLKDKSPCQNIVATYVQKQVACQVEEIAFERGLDESQIMALIINSFAESALNPKAESSGKKSFGIFQLHVDGLGYGWSEKDMKNVRLATHAIIDEMERVGAIKKNRPVSWNTKTICKKVLRPKNSEQKAEERKLMIKKLYKKDFLLKTSIKI
jgi:hypothetical protein